MYRVSTLEPRKSNLTRQPLHEEMFPLQAVRSSRLDTHKAFISLKTSFTWLRVVRSGAYLGKCRCGEICSFRRWMYSAALPRGQIYVGQISGIRCCKGGQEVVLEINNVLVDYFGGHPVVDFVCWGKVLKKEETFWSEVKLKKLQVCFMMHVILLAWLQFVGRSSTGIHIAKP